MPGIDYSSHIVNPVAQGPAAAVASARDSSSDFSFGDFLDIINPLQHIPVVSTLYRALTGDEIGTPEKIAGDTLYGGILGGGAIGGGVLSFFSSVADCAFKAVTGKDVGDTVLAFLTGGDDSTPAMAVAAGAYDNAAKLAVDVSAAPSS